MPEVQRLEPAVNNGDGVRGRAGHHHLQASDLDDGAVVAEYAVDQGGLHAGLPTGTGDALVRNARNRRATSSGVTFGRPSRWIDPDLMRR